MEQTFQDTCGLHPHATFLNAFKNTQFLDGKVRVTFVPLHMAVFSNFLEMNLYPLAFISKSTF